MGHRNDRHRHPGESRDLTGEHASGVDHDLGLDVALVRLDAPHPPVLDAEAGDAGVLGDLRAAPPGALGQRIRQL